MVDLGFGHSYGGPGGVLVQMFVPILDLPLGGEEGYQKFGNMFI